MYTGQASNLVAKPGSQFDVRGGRVTGQIEADSAVDIRGGRINLLFDTGPNADITISGGAIERIDVRDSPIVLEGVGFSFDGVPVTGLNSVGDMRVLTVPIDSVLTGVLADGRALGYQQPQGYIDPLHVVLIRSATPPLPSPPEIHVANDSALEWIGDGQTAFVEPGGSLVEHFRGTE